MSSLRESTSTCRLYRIVVSLEDDDSCVGILLEEVLDSLLDLLGFLF